jgi:monoamine oxidase
MNGSGHHQVSKYAVIGAGPSGTYTAWRLAQQAEDLGISPSDILIADPFRIEGKPHIGGRLWSARLPGAGRIRRAELGGMRFLDSQVTVCSLVEYLNLPVVNFPVDSASTSFMLRSALLGSGDFSDPAKVPYSLSGRERGMSPGTLMKYAVQSIVPEAPYLSSAEWRQIHGRFRFQGELLRDQGAWTVLQTVLSQDGFALVQNGSGYDTFTTNWNAADAMQWMMADFSPSSQYLYVKNGFETVPRTLFEQATALGVRYQNWRLKAWTHGGRGVILTFDTGNDSEVRWEAEHLILAMPRRSIELIDRPPSKTLDQMLPAVTPEHMFKFFVGYPYPWWRALGSSLGRTVTDGPLRQVYYWGSNDQGFFPHGAPDANVASADADRLPGGRHGQADHPQNSLLMVYCDGRNTGYWKPLFDAVKSDDKNGLVHDAGELAGCELHDANSHFRVLDIATCRRQQSVRVLLAAIAHEMKAAHGISYVPEPYVLAYADWTVDPFGGAYNLWKPGYDSHTITNAIRTPYGTNVPVFIVGEAYSLRQGWVEGALQTAEQLCEEQFGLRRPEWLPANFLE